MADWPMIAVRFALYLVMSALFGLSAFGLHGLRATERHALPLRPWLLASAALALLLSCGWLVLLVSAMAGATAWPIDMDAIGAALNQPGLGAAWKVRMAALAFASSAALLAGRRAGLAIVAISSGVALAALAWTGHGATGDDATGWAHLVADIFHLVAAGAWVGALLGLVLLVTRPAARVDAKHLGLTHRALRGFGTVGLIVVGTIVVTGLVNGSLLVGVGHVTTLGTTLYGRLLIAKLTLFVAMLGLALLNRFRLTPALERSIAGGDHRDALVALRWSLAVETSCVVFVLGLVAWLGTLAPPISTS